MAGWTAYLPTPIENLETDATVVLAQDVSPT